MMKKNYRLCYVLACALTFGWNSQLLANETVVDGDDAAAQEMPAYQNPAQAAHDANLAQAAFDKIDAEIAAMQEELAEAEAAEDQAKIDELTARIDEKVSERTGIEEGRIADLRASGMGWGEIAHELGVHPGALGLGHSKDRTGGWKSAANPISIDQEIVAATAMDLNSGKTKGHSSGNAAASAGSKNGKSSGSVEKSQDSHGNKGGNGHGNGGGNGGGNGRNK